MPIVRGTFTDTFLEDQLPAIEGDIMTPFKRWPELYSQYLNVENTTRDISQRTQIAGFQLLAEVAENAPVTYDEPAQGFDKTYKPVQLALGFKVSRVAFDDDKYGWIKKLAGDLGRSAIETIETRAANIFNNGFTDTGPDGKVLFATDHPDPKGGGAQANRPTNHVDLSVPALQAALTDIRKWKDTSGRRARFQPKMLMVPPDLWAVASEILGGTMRSDTANNTINAFQKIPGLNPFNTVLVNEYLTDVDGWFVGSDKEDVATTLLWRERPNTMYGEDFDTRGLKTALWCRFVASYHDWRGWWGTAGA